MKKKKIEILLGNEKIDVNADGDIDGERMVWALGALVISVARKAELKPLDIVYQALPKALEEIDNANTLEQQHGK